MEYNRYIQYTNEWNQNEKQVNNDTEPINDWE